MPKQSTGARSLLVLTTSLALAGVPAVAANVANAQTATPTPVSQQAGVPAMVAQAAPPASTAGWAASSSFTAHQAKVGKPFTISTRIKAPRAAKNVVVQIWVESSTSGKSGKQFQYTHQTLGPAARRFTSTFTPPAAGSYRVKVGVFSADYKKLHYWTNLAGVFGTPMHATSGKILGAGKKPRVLTMGDSITYGYNGKKNGGTGGYRPTLWKLLKAKGQVVSPVGPQDGPPKGSHHGGFPGERIRDIAGGMPGVSPSAVSQMYAYSPDVVLLHIGTNDFTLRDDPAHAAKRADALIDSLVKARPSAHIFVARIVNSYAPVPIPAVKAYNDAVQAHVKALAAKGKHVYTVNEDRAVTKKSDLGDGVHPTDATYARMAKIWAAKLEQVNARQK